MSQQHKKLQWHLAGHWNNPIRKSDFEQRKTTVVGDKTTTSLSDGPRIGKNYHYGLRGGIDYAFTPKTSVNAELQVVYDKFTREGDLDYTETHSNSDAASAPSNYFSRDKYDLHSTVNIGKAGFSHKFNDNGHTLTGSFMLGYEDNPLEYFQSDLFDKNEQRQQGHRAWEDEKRWTVKAICPTAILIARPVCWKAGINIIRIWKTEITRCNSGIRRKGILLAGGYL